jgi:hypothetical protein
MVFGHTVEAVSRLHRPELAAVGALPSVTTTQGRSR